MSSIVKSTEESLHKIKKVSLLFRLLFQAVFIIFPIILVLYWLQAPTPLGFFLDIQISFINNPFSAWKVMHELSSAEKLIGFLLSWLSMGVVEVVLYFLIKLFRLYENAEIFTMQNVRYIKNIAYVLLVGQVLSPIQEGLMSAALTWHNPHGYKVAAFSFSGGNMGVILMAFFLLLISWIMTEGYRLKEEQALTV
jgi:hypothetical protein